MLLARQRLDREELRVRGDRALEPDDGDPSEVLNAASRAMKPAPRRRA
jgi:hypothetical protein